MFACAAGNPRRAEAPSGALRETGLRAADDPTVWGARLFPEALDEGHGWGIEPGGGVRAIVAGVRVVSMGGGAMVVAPDRLPATPSNVVALPERMGAGFLFAIGTHLWGSKAWLARADALFTSPIPIAQVLVGLDRVYLRSPQGVLIALDPRRGVPTGLGPLPASPNVGRLAAFDAWRAVVIADLRGTLLTVDAGSTWRPLVLPIDPTDVIPFYDSIAVGGPNEASQMQWWEVRSDGQTGRLSSKPSSSATPDRAPAPTDAVARALGPRPLATAIEDGWSLADGTALVARDGAIARVRLTDGTIVESIKNAFPFKPARCHALSLARPQEPGAIGFVCGEPRGRTIVYRWDAQGARLAELQRFENPREVLGFSNGALAVRGPCASDAGDAAAGTDQAWCVMPPGAAWKDMRAGSDERLVVLSDGRVVLVRPPRAGDWTTARLTVADGGARAELPITLPALHPDVSRALGFGVWMDGFEERRAGVVGGWVDAAGSIVGLEIALDGEVRVGEFIRDAGAPVASGRWAFGWTASRRGFETTDGGMTWTKEIGVPEPIASGRAVTKRACGPIGCIAAGWLRVGWGPTGQVPAPDPPPRVPIPMHMAPGLELDCETLIGAAPESATSAALARPSPRLVARSAVVRAPVGGVYTGSNWGTVSELPSFAGRNGPIMPADDLGLSVEARSGLERGLREMPLARVYAWGPKSGEWEHLGRWQVRWQWPWGSGSDLRSSAAASAPWTSLDGARRAVGAGPGTPTTWTLAQGDDPDHALMLARRTMGGPAVDVLLLETDRPPVEVRRPRGDAFPDVEGAARLGGRWYIATTQSPGELAASVVWSLEGATAREVVRLPRVGFESRPALRLARSADGRTLGLVVDGQPDESHATALRWVTAVDVESNTVATPELLAPADLSDRPVSFCTGDDPGWEIDLPYPGTVRLHLGARWESTVQAPLVRMRLSRERACVERALGSVDGYATAPPSALTSATYPPGSHAREGARTIDMTVFSARARYGLRCAGR